MTAPTDPAARPKPGSWVMPSASPAGAIPRPAPAPPADPAGGDVSKMPCPKCGSPETTLAFQPARPACPEGCCASRDAFRRACRACGYRWRTHDVHPDPTS